MKKRILATVVCLCIMAAAILPVAQARWTNTRSITLGMSFGNGVVTSEGQITGYAGTALISATFTLEKLVNGQYEYVDSWTAGSTTLILGSTRYTPDCTTGTYKLSVSGTVTKDGYAEPVSDWLIKTFY